MQKKHNVNHTNPSTCTFFQYSKKTARGKARAAISKSQRVGFRVTTYFKEGYITF